MFRSCFTNKIARTRQKVCHSLFLKQIFISETLCQVSFLFWKQNFVLETICFVSFLCFQKKIQTILNDDCSHVVKAFCHKCLFLGNKNFYLRKQSESKPESKPLFKKKGHAAR